MQFQNHDDYMSQREAQVAEMTAAAEACNAEEVARLENSIKDLDAAYETFKLEMANIAALEKEAVPMANIVEAQSVDIMDTIDARKDFMNYVLTGKLTNAVTHTTDAGVVIPSTVMNKIVEKIEATGMILADVTRTSYKGGLSIPVSTVKPSATWVSEGAGSTDQKYTMGAVTFAYNKLRCSVAVTLEVDTMALEVFENTIARNIAEAMVKALEQAIVTGSGTAEPKGILAETPATGQALTTTALSYADIVACEAALPLAYEQGAKWYMSKKTFMDFIGLVDSNGQPIARENFGLEGAPKRYLLGREVVCNNYMPVAGQSGTTVIAFLFRPEDYVLNTNLNVTVKQYEDNTTDDKITKAVMLVDGKVIDKNSLVTLSK